MISKFPPEYSGPGVRIPRLYKWLEGKGHNINLQILCNGIEHTKNETYHHDGYIVRRITAGFFYILFSKLPQKLSHWLTYNIEFIKTFGVLSLSKNYKNIDFLHVAGHSGGTAAALLWARMRCIPVLMELVNSSATPYQKIFSFFKITAPKVSKIAFLTKKQSQSFEKDFQNKIWIKPNPVDINKFYYDEKLDQNSQKIILSIAKFMPRKNQVFMVEVMRHLPSNFKLILAGPRIQKGRFLERDTEYFNDIVHRVGKYELKERVEIVQEYVEPDDYMKRANIYVMPAWDEGLGTPMIEAMACGVPVVANQSEPAFQEWIEPEVNGFLMSVDTAENWAKAIIKAGDFDVNQKKTISNNIKDKVSQEIIFNDYQKNISDLIKV